MSGTFDLCSSEETRRIVVKKREAMQRARDALLGSLELLKGDLEVSPDTTCYTTMSSHVKIVGIS